MLFVVGFGVFGGLVTLILTVAMAQGKKPRAQVKFQSEADLWPQIEQWCKANDYQLRSDVNGRRLYQRGSGLWQAAARVEASRNGNEWQIDGFLFVTFLVTHAEVAFDETGMIAKLPRDNRKKEFNMLLQQLGQPQLA